MYTYMYIYMYVQYTCKCICTCMCNSSKRVRYSTIYVGSVYVYVHVYTNYSTIYMYMCVCTCKYTYMYTYAQLYTYVNEYVYMWKCVNVKLSWKYIECLFNVCMWFCIERERERERERAIFIYSTYLGPADITGHDSEVQCSVIVPYNILIWLKKSTAIKKTGKNKWKLIKMIQGLWLNTLLCWSFPFMVWRFIPSRNSYRIIWWGICQKVSSAKM